MFRMDGDAVIIVLAAFAQVVESTFLFFEIETGCVWEPEERHYHARETKPWNDVEFRLRIDVIIQNTRSESAEFSNRGGEAVRCGADRSREDFGCDEEGYGVGAELVEE